jgi:uncharacterized protein (DUF1800 family)
MFFTHTFLFSCVRSVVPIAIFSMLQACPAIAAAAQSNSNAIATLNNEDARFLLARTGFTPSEAEVAKLVGQTRQQAVNDMLNHATQTAITPPPSFVTEAIVPYKTLATEDARKAERQQQARYSLELKAWWMKEMLETPSPLSERMTLFWHNHFASGQPKVRYTQPVYRQNILIRANALGNFRDLLQVISKDPVMLVYLDGANSRKEAPNENFAREVMELFTLGEATAGGNYTEADIKNAARAFTGWSIEQDDFTYRYRPAAHDASEKRIFGKTGTFTGEEVLDIILEQPHVAVYITGKLWKEFVSAQPDEIEVRRIAAAFRQSRYDIKVVMRELLLSDAFWSAQNRATLVKSPVELVVGAMREFNFGYTDATPLALRVANMGQNLFAPPNVKGWPVNTAWIDSTSLLDRKRFLEQLFRAIEMPDKAALSMQAARADVNDMTGGQKIKGAGKALGREGIFKVAQAQANIWFDAEAWLKQYGGYIDREPTVPARLAIQKALLPIEPANATAMNTQNAALKDGTVGIAYLRQLVLDPTYQLK